MFAGVHTITIKRAYVHKYRCSLTTTMFFDFVQPALRFINRLSLDGKRKKNDVSKGMNQRSFFFASKTTTNLQRPISMTIN